MIGMAITTKPKIVVVGGGFGGLEAASHLRWRLPEAEITLVSDDDRFLFRPNTIYVPFGLDPERLTRRLHAPLQHKRIAFVHRRAHEIDTDNKTVSVNGQTLPYDFLVVATGAAMRPQEIRGLAEYAENIWSVGDMLKLRQAFAAIVSDAQNARRTEVLFLVPPNNKCSGPLYEIVMMFETWLRQGSVRNFVGITWSTYESNYIQAFGPELHRHVSYEFDRRGIAGHTDFAAHRVEHDRVLYRNGKELPFDLLVSFPPYVAASMFDSLPTDERGFIETDMSTRQVKDLPDVFAVGDAGDFPVKQAFLAFLQADAVAANLVSRIQGDRPGASFKPNSLCIMEELDQATYAQVPLRVTGDPDRPVEVRIDREYPYRVGTSKAWRAGKWALGKWLPSRLGRANPFHAGRMWNAGAVGLRFAAALLSQKIPVTRPIEEQFRRAA